MKIKEGGHVKRFLSLGSCLIVFLRTRVALMAPTNIRNAVSVDEAALIYRHSYL